jgi:hypothetical protein
MALLLLKQKHSWANISKIIPHLTISTIIFHYGEQIEHFPNNWTMNATDNEIKTKLLTSITLYFFLNSLYHKHITATCDITAKTQCKQSSKFLSFTTIIIRKCTGEIAHHYDYLFSYVISSLFTLNPASWTFSAVLCTTKSFEYRRKHLQRKHSWWRTIDNRNPKNKQITLINFDLVQFIII